LCIAGLTKLDSRKSQLAIEVAHRLTKEIKNLLVLFIRASSELEFEQNYMESALDTPMAGAETRSAFHIIKHFVNAEPSERWLLIVDGVDAWDTLFGPKKFIEHLPQDSDGIIIFTSRNRDLALELVQFESTNLFHLHRFSKENAVELLINVSNGLGADADCQRELVKELEYLPLAVTQAAKVIRRNPIDIYGYLKLYRENDIEKFKLLDTRTRYQDTKSTDTITRTWVTTFDHIERDCKYAARIMYFIACLHPHEIPYCFFPR